MKFWQRTPLAFQNLTYKPRQMLVAGAGIGFAVLLMFMETGFQYALTDSTVEVVKKLNADIILVSRAKYSLTTSQPFDISRIHAARTCAGVKSAYPVYCEPYYSIWRRRGSKSYPIRVLAFRLGDPVFTFADLANAVPRLRAPHTALIDKARKRKYGFPDFDDPVIDWREAELNNLELRIVGMFQMGTDFANDGNLIMSAANFRRFFPNRVRDRDVLDAVDIGVVKVEGDDVEEDDVQEVCDRLEALFPKDTMLVYTQKEYIENEVKFWKKSTPIGFIFSVGTVMGFAVGVIICYQIIYSSNADHLSEFATLKAMGYRPRYFIGLVLSQSLYLSLLGYFPGLLVSLLLYHVLRLQTGLLMELTVPRALVVLGMTLGMCILSGVLAMRKVLLTDPAELF